jgi:hypothetical protein
MYGNYTISESCDNHNHVCPANAHWTGNGTDLDPSEYFIDDLHSSILTRFLYMISCLALILFSGTLSHYLEKRFTTENNVFYRNFSIFSLVFLILIFVIDVSMMERETCLFPRWCHEGIDDQIIPAFYFYQMNECPRYTSWLAYYYEQTDTWNNGDDCGSSVYGCCKVREIGCDAFYTDGHTYSEYVSLMGNYDGRWQLSVDKQDEEGSNCPTVEELIYQVSKNDKNDYLVLYLSYTITAMIITCLCMICRNCIKKEEYEKMGSDDVEKTPGKRAEKVERVTMKESV